MDRFKFRYWDNVCKEMVYLDYDIGLYTHALIIWERQLVDYGCEGALLDDDTPIMQCTGLKDKNGVLIYEGDVLQSSYRRWSTYFIEWRQHGAGFYYTPCFPDDHHALEREPHRLQHYIVKNDEIIGNVYQNPELLEETP